jgi:hypothetical protein
VVRFSNRKSAFGEPPNAAREPRVLPRTNALVSNVIRDCFPHGCGRGARR